MFANESFDVSAAYEKLFAEFNAFKKKYPKYFFNHIIPDFEPNTLIGHNYFENEFKENFAPLQQSFNEFRYYAYKSSDKSKYKKFIKSFEKYVLLHDYYEAQTKIYDLQSKNYFLKQQIKQLKSTNKSLEDSNYHHKIGTYKILADADSYDVSILNKYKPKVDSSSQTVFARTKIPKNKLCSSIVFSNKPCEEVIVKQELFKELANQKHVSSNTIVFDKEPLRNILIFENSHETSVSLWDNNISEERDTNDFAALKHDYETEIAYLQLQLKNTLAEKNYCQDIYLELLVKSNTF